MHKFLLAAASLWLLLSGQLLHADDRVQQLRQAGLVGNFYPAQNAAKPGVLVLGGSEGGIPDKLAAPMVQAGYPVLALAYFKAEGLPQELEKIPLEYFDRAKQFLRQQANVSQDELIVVGWSKGAELALLLASRDPSITRVIAIAPSAVRWAGILKDWTKVPSGSWTEQGKELTFVPFHPSGPVNGLRDLYSQSLTNRTDQGKADIEVEKIKAPVILLTGTEDEIWPSPLMAEHICAKMRQAKAGQCRHRDYPGLDHLLDLQFLAQGNALHSEFMSLLAGE